MIEKTVPSKNQSQVNHEKTRKESRFIKPSVDICETDNGLKLIADLPGVDKENLSVKVDDGILSIEGKMTLKENSKHVVFEEFSGGIFYRQFELPEKVAQEEIVAELNNGVLTLLLPGKAEEKPREIKVTIK
jgi:HSP20 family molecular chaperone IbpA